MPAQPINKHNAIDAFAFAVQLSAPISCTDGQRIADMFATELPGRRTMQGLFVQLGAAPDIEPPALVTRFRARPDGTDAWALQINGPIISVTCRDYDRYSVVWPDAQKQLRTALAAVGGAAVVTEATLQIVDRFRYDRASGYDLTAVFDPETEYLTRHVRRCGALWHVHQGWFDTADPRRLYQLNLSNIQPIGPTSGYETLIDFRGTERNIAVAAARAADELADTFVALHEINKDMLRTLLTVDMRRAIALEDPA